MDESVSHGKLGIIVMDNCKELGKRIEEHILAMRGESKGNESYILPINQVRFSNGEGKVSLANSVRGKDIFIVSDVGNYSCTYRMFGQDTMIGPDEHFQDIKRVLSAIGGKANRITVVMPLLYASRQHRRKGRESLDCAMALKELENLGVDAIITFDVHDPNIHNAIPNCSFENILPTYSILKSFMNTEGPETREKLTVISPDTGAMDRAIFYASVLGVDVGMFYKRRDHTRIVNGKNPIVEHKYIGGSLKDYNVLIVDDMIAFGESVVDIISKIQRYKVKHTYVATTFAFFTEGVAKFDKLYKEGKLTKLYSTNLSYIPEEIKSRPWFVEVDLSKFIAKVINTLSHDESISPLLDATARFKRLLKAQEKEKEKAAQKDTE
ncbi:MAG: ribose-phosphate pyrophosphokinase [Clostridia bacterium]|nr:ribose-phosphate pyrophosphokinase [Clostridia bacterium]